MNKLSVKKVPIKQLSSGTHLDITVFEITGNKPGPCCYIQSSVHGAEIMGNAVISNLLQTFSKIELKGKLIIVPFANPMASSQKSGTYTQGRFNPVTGNNWNRNYIDLFYNSMQEIEQFVQQTKNETPNLIRESFKKIIKSKIKHYLNESSQYGPSEESNLTLTLQNLASEADIVLDFHTGPVAVDYLYSTTDQREDARNFPFSFVVEIPEEFAGAMDEACKINWSYLNKVRENNGLEKIPFYSYTVELESEETIQESRSIELTKKVLSYLKYHQMHNQEDLQQVQQICFQLNDFKTYYAPSGGLINYLKKPGDHVKKGQLLAKLTNFSSIKSWEDLDSHVRPIICQKDCYIINHCPSGNIHQGMEIFQVAENYKQVN